MIPTGGYVDSHRDLIQGDQPRAVKKTIKWMDERDIQQSVIPMAIRVEPGRCTRWPTRRRRAR